MAPLFRVAFFRSYDFTGTDGQSIGKILPLGPPCDGLTTCSSIPTATCVVFYVLNNVVSDYNVGTPFRLRMAP